jgi:hypothetical protein
MNASMQGVHAIEQCCPNSLMRSDLVSSGCCCLNEPCSANHAMTCTEQQLDSAITQQQRPLPDNPHRPDRPLSLGDKACIYDWLRDAAITGSSAEWVLGILRGAAARAVSPRDFDEIVLKAMTLQEAGKTGPSHAR